MGASLATFPSSVMDFVSHASRVLNAQHQVSHYDILGFDESWSGSKDWRDASGQETWNAARQQLVTAADIRKQGRALLLAYHPDKGRTPNPEMLERVQMALAVLKPVELADARTFKGKPVFSEEARRRYDGVPVLDTTYRMSVAERYRWTEDDTMSIDVDVRRATPQGRFQDGTTRQAVEVNIAACPDDSAGSAHQIEVVRVGSDVEKMGLNAAGGAVARIHRGNVRVQLKIGPLDSEHDLDPSEVRAKSYRRRAEALRVVMLLRVRLS